MPRVVLGAPGGRKGSRRGELFEYDAARVGMHREQLAKYYEQIISRRKIRTDTHINKSLGSEERLNDHEPTHEIETHTARFEAERREYLAQKTRSSDAVAHRGHASSSVFDIWFSVRARSLQLMD